MVENKKHLAGSSVKEGALTLASVPRGNRSKEKKEEEVGADPMLNVISAVQFP